ncbi:MAG TPA: hypothetical protein PKZ76_14050 [Xanthomonadaceae bacterium]|nr:hypothetical protein [Xanthomonadaceae bacterium]
MKKQVTGSKGDASKRDVFSELAEGFAALADAREGKQTLRTHAVSFHPAPEVAPSAR